MATTKVTTNSIDMSSNAGGLTWVKGTTAQRPAGASVSNCNYPTTATALYQLEGNANDTCGNYNGTAANITYTSGSGGKYGEAAIFNGTSSYIDLNLKNKFIGTISIWFNGATPSSLCFLYASTAGSSSNNGVALIANTDGTIRILIGQGISGSFALDVSTTDTFFDSNWYNAVLTWDLSSAGTNVYLYINDVEKASGAATTGNWTTGQDSSDLILGHYNTAGGSETFNGNIDQVRIFPSVLSSTDITKLQSETTTGTLSIGNLRENTETNRTEVFTNQLASAATVSDCNYPTTASALYQFDDDVTDTCNNYNGTAYNLNAYVTGKFGKAASFNGTSSRVDITSPIGQNASNENDDFSISVWVYWTFITGTAGASNGTISGNSSGSSNSSFAIYSYGNAAGISVAFERFFNNTGYYSSGYLTAAPFAAVINKWYNLVFTYAGSTKTVTTYVDGTALPTYTLNTNAGSRTMNTVNSFGSYNGISYGHLGYLDQIRIFPSVLSQPDVTKLQNETTTSGASSWRNLKESAVVDETYDTEYLVVAGGGGGGYAYGGGGGAGGYLTNFGSTKITLAKATGYTITVGTGGAGGIVASTTYPTNGLNSVFTGGSGFTASGGGTGGNDGDTNQTGGGSGGGVSRNTGGTPGGATGSPSSQGNIGGQGYYPGNNDTGFYSGGGGGAGAAGQNAADAYAAAQSTAGAGGAGLQNNIDGNNYFYAGGGGGAAIRVSNTTQVYGGAGGSSIGGTGGDFGGTGVGNVGKENDATDASPVNRGSGGGGGSMINGSDGAQVTGNGGAGSSGVVILRNKRATATLGSGITVNGISGPNSVNGTSIGATGDYFYSATLGTGTITF